MHHPTRGRVAAQVARHRCGAAGAVGQLPFAHLLNHDHVERVLQQHKATWRQQIFTPMVVLFAFLGQTMSGDQSCRAAVARVLAWLVGEGHDGCSANSGAYCTARARLPEAVPRTLMRDIGAQLHEEHGARSNAFASSAPSHSSRATNAPGRALLGGRPIKLIDGSTATMPDTPANQEAYPQPAAQKPGLGFPIVRFVALLCLHTGAVIDAAMGPYLGKQTGENALFRRLFSSLKRGDVIVGDRCFGSYWHVAMLMRQGVDCIFRLHQMRPVDFRRGIRLGRNDRLVEWRKPRSRPAWMSAATYAAMPDVLQLRQMRFKVNVPGFRTQSIVVVTTLLDSDAVTVNEVAEIYRMRWHAELDLRSIKCAMRMDVFRGKSPDIVRKEFWMSLLAYNLVRRAMAQAAQTRRVLPRQISFTGALQTLAAFATARSDAARIAMLSAIATHRVATRPNRVEPRAVKKRGKPHKLLTEPRKLAQTRLLKAA